MHIVEIIFELIMQALLGVLFYLFWKGYRNTKSRSLLIITVLFATLFAFHLLFPLILEDILGYQFDDPIDPHHIIFVVTLLILTYVLLCQNWWRGAKLQKGFGERTDRREDKSA